MLLFNPSAYDAAHYDEPTRCALMAVRRFFEAKGHTVLKAESHDASWYDDFLEMNAREGVFARFGTPAAVATLTSGTDATTARWDTARNNDLSELLAWYSL
jgi:acyl-CoA dehydrogenase